MAPGWSAQGQHGVQPKLCNKGSMAKAMAKAAKPLLSCVLCPRLHEGKSLFTLQSFPYREALKAWKAMRTRRMTCLIVWRTASSGQAGCSGCDPCSGVARLPQGRTRHIHGCMGAL